MENINFKAGFNQPNPLEVKYWVDLKADSQGGIIKYYNYNTSAWEPIQKQDITPGITEDQVNELIGNYILPSYDGTVSPGTIEQQFMTLAKALDDLKVEVAGYNIWSMSSKIDDNSSSITDILSRLDALEAKP